MGIYQSIVDGSDNPDLPSCRIEGLPSFFEELPSFSADSSTEIM
jgi:hypothetical protein